MRTVLTLVRYQWASYWRRLRRAGGVSAANQGILLLILTLVVIKYFQLLHIATINLTQGNTTLLSSLLTGIFVAWLFPLTSGTRVSGSFLHLPLSYQKLFAVRLLSLLIPPTSWLIVLASLAIFYPLAHAPNPAAGIFAALLFITISWQIGVALAHLLSISIWRKMFALLILFSLLAAVVYFRNGVGASGLNSVTSFGPVSLVVDAALGKQPWIALGTLALLAVAAWCIAFWSFRQSLEVVTTRPRKRMIFGGFRLPGRLGGLISKDFRYFRRLLDSYLGLLVSVLCYFHLVMAEAPSADVVRIFIMMLFLANSAIAFNLFGLDDRNGLDRYTLLPLSGAATLLSKNLAFLLLVEAQLFPIFLLALWRLGFWETAGTIVQSISLAAGYLAWGNWMSVSQPVKLQFFRFSSSGAALADSIGGLMFGSLPGILIIYLLRGRGAGVAGGTALILLLTGALYFFSVTRFGGRLERNRERIAEALM